MKNSTYAVIVNPRNWINKHEVWFKGTALGQDERGFAKEIDVTKKVQAFRTAEQAEGFIKYQQEVESFVG